MIAPKGVSTRCWRILSPRRQHAPLSGEGAARHGGRWNRPGQTALYLSESVETAFAENQQELGVRPGTFVAYDILGGTIAELTRSDGRIDSGVRILGNLPAQTEIKFEVQDLLTPWKEAAFVEVHDPVTWGLADMLCGAFDGVRVPSAQYPGGVNVVLWRWNDGDAPTVTFFDPRAELNLKEKPD